MSATIEKARELLGERLSELDGEKQRIERAREALNLNGGGPPRRRPSTSRRRGPARRKRSGGTRIEQAVKIVTANPGIQGGEIAKRMKIKPNYLYRVLSDLVREGRLRKEGRTYYLAEVPGKLTLRG